MTRLGYAPVKLLMSTSIYSLGFAGGFLAAFKSFVKGEINELTTMIHDARESPSPGSRTRPTGSARRTWSGSRPISPKSPMAWSSSFAARHRRQTDARRGLASAEGTLPTPGDHPPSKDTWIDGDFGFSLDRNN